MLRLVLASTLAALAAGAPAARGAPAGQAPRAVAADALPAAPELYARAVQRLLRGAPEITGADLVLLPSDAAEGLAVRARRGAGPPIPATGATVRAVVAALARDGVRGARGAAATKARSGALQLVLGELRYEPPADPRFARLRIGVIGVDGARETTEFLMVRERDGWRAFNMRIVGGR
jgi:hypothetical protein